VFFRLLYHQFAWSYDFVAYIVSLGNWQTWIASVVDELSGPEILELGHGPGHLQVFLTQNNIKTTGIDISRQMGRIAARRLCRKGYDFRLLYGKAQRLPFEDGTFNEVVSTFPSEYIFDPETIQETYRVLVPGGKFVILPVAITTGDHFLERLTSRLFQITGQSIPPDKNALSLFENYGFVLQTKWVKKPGWEALILTAQKPETGSRTNH
jgi:ubiquinone/menaquinone biosynthesis C-methylase UbiE